MTPVERDYLDSNAAHATQARTVVPCAGIESFLGRGYVRTPAPFGPVLRDDATAQSVIGVLVEFRPESLPLPQGVLGQASYLKKHRIMSL